MTKKKMTKKTPTDAQPQTYEEFLAREWEQFNVHDARDEHLISPANYHYRVGERVRLGYIPDCRVEEILKDGKLIHFSHHDRGEMYGRPWDNNRRLPRLNWWHELEPIEPEEATSFGRRDYLNPNYISTTLFSLLNTMYSRGFADSPVYQRGYVWTLEDKQRLIQSIMDRLDIGKFLFLEHPYPYKGGHQLEVIDGKQRISAIKEFYEGRFEFKGKTWFQFSRDDKYVFTDAPIQTANMDAERVSKVDILWLFLTVNTGGVPQTEEHIAKVRQMYEDAVKEQGSA